MWTPRPGEMQVYLVNGSLTGRASGQPIPATDPNNFTLFTYPTLEFDPTHVESHNYSTFTPVFDNEGGVIDYTESSHSGNFVSCEAPFYTNPISWEYGSSEEPYIKLMVPWDRQPGVSTGGVSYGTASKNYYYRVYCPGDPIDGTHAQFVRNNWYKIVLNVGVLGSDTDGGESIINGQYYVVDWQEREASDPGTGGSSSGVNDSDKEAEIKGARYLFINKEVYELFNVNELAIPYTTSDPCEIVDITGKYYTFNETTKKEMTIDASSWLSLSSVGGAHIQFTHTLNNDTSRSDYDTSEYIITFTLRQKDNHSYMKEIIIHQYPAIMIDMDSNPGDDSNHHGYTYVNNGTNTNYVGNTNGTSSGNNTNFNMFLIQTTVLPASSDYMLGDPRTTYVDNIHRSSWPNSTEAQRTGEASSWSASAPSVNGGTRYLKYYYPVDRSSKANNIIAPKFRIASSHGATNALTYDAAFRRCASYQEKGYPAGRWRLPTVAEIMYITKLSTDGVIVRLFGSSSSSNNGETSEYWCNSGYISVHDGTDDSSKLPPTAYPGVTSRSGNTYVRCVYDEWYWSGIKVNGTDVSTVSQNQFTWGDIER